MAGQYEHHMDFGVSGSKALNSWVLEERISVKKWPSSVIKPEFRLGIYRMEPNYHLKYLKSSNRSLESSAYHGTFVKLGSNAFLHTSGLHRQARIGLRAPRTLRACPQFALLKNAKKNRVMQAIIQSCGLREAWPASSLSVEWFVRVIRLAIAFWLDMLHRLEVSHNWGFKKGVVHFWRLFYASWND